MKGSHNMKAIIIIAACIILIRILRNRTGTNPKRQKTVTEYKITYKPNKPDRYEPEKKRTERTLKTQFERTQASNELIHLRQVEKDLLQAYERSNVIQSDTEKGINKRIAYDNKLRSVQRKIEKQQYILDKNRL